MRKLSIPRSAFITQFKTICGAFLVLLVATFVLAGKATAEDGVCGYADGKYFNSAPADDLLCSAGTPTALTGKNSWLGPRPPLCHVLDFNDRWGGPWDWQCVGPNGGSTVNCYSGGIVVVTVDGMALGGLLLDQDQPDDPPYLYSALQTAEIEETDCYKDANIGLQAFSWSQNPHKTEDTVNGQDGLRARLRKEYLNAHSHNRKLVVVAHSWGTFLSYASLALESQEADPVIADVFVSLSSPLGTGWVSYNQTKCLAESIIPCLSGCGLTPDPLDCTAACEAPCFVIPGIIKFTFDELSSLNLFPSPLRPRVRYEVVNFWALGDPVSGPLNLFPYFTSADGSPMNVFDIQLDSYPDQPNPPERMYFDVLSQPDWHHVTSLVPGGDPKYDGKWPRMAVMGTIRGLFPPDIRIYTPNDSVKRNAWFSVANSGTDGVQINVSGDYIVAEWPMNITCADNGNEVFTTNTNGSFVLENGIHSISCTATNQYGITGAGPGSTAMPVLYKVDQIAPAIAIASPAQGGAYIYNSVETSAYTCTDQVGLSGLETCNGPVVNGANFDTATLGPHTFTVSSTDRAGNASSSTISYSVIYNFGGFLKPVDSSTLNIVNAGSSVPIKFSLARNYGLGILAANSPSSRQIDCTSLAPLGNFEPTSPSGKSGLSYDPLTDQYKYTWKTQQSWSGTCREFAITLIDNTTHLVSYKFTK